MKNKPVLYVYKKDCCGCAACYSICPRMAISMVPDDEGFMYPSVDSNQCISCNLCIKVCPQKR
ncbi:4Fe-4S binding protein [Butyrivibrio sp. LC3010]|uniref:4Fe-4S binding protein n=1 Tax=Butyrivibrio sp. LC3010 TaxID=1280680 RepID=UPI0009DBC7EF